MLTKQDIQNNVASNFKWARASLKFTQQKMADALDIKIKSYQKIEEQYSITYVKVYKLSKLINVSMDTIFLTDLSKVK
jgi:DNA-binding XRE family transcriptional regulator